MFLFHALAYLMPREQHVSDSHNTVAVPPSGAERVACRLLMLIGRLEKVLCVTAFVLLVVVLFADVVSRELTAAGLHWASQIGVWANVAVVMAGFGLASASGAHLRPRFLDAFMPAGWDNLLGFVQHCVMALFCSAIGWVSLLVVTESFRLGEVEITLFWPVWPVQALLPLAFFAAAVRHLIYAIYPRQRPADTGAFDVSRSERVSG